MLTSAHPGPSARSRRATLRSLAPGGPFGVPGGVGQVWALLFSLPVSVSHLLAPYWRYFSLQSREIRLRVHVRVYSHSNQLRRLFSEPSLLRASPSPDPPFSPYFSAFFPRRVERLLRKVARYASRPYPSGRRRDIRHRCSPFSAVL